MKILDSLVIGQTILVTLPSGKSALAKVVRMGIGVTISLLEDSKPYKNGETILIDKCDINSI